MKIENCKLKINHVNFKHYSKVLRIWYFALPRYLQKVIAITLTLSLTLSVASLLLMFGPWRKSAEAAWFNENWAYRKAVTVTVSSSSSDITNLETLITVDTTGITAKLQTSCQDLRFTNTNGKLLPYYIDSCNDNSATNKIWVMADLVPKNTTTYTMYMYYGNPSASAASNSALFDNVVNLKAYWTFNDGSGTAPKDSSISGNNLALSCTGASCTNASWATGNYSNALLFNSGTGNNWAGTSTNIDYSATDAFTVEAWVKPTNTATCRQSIVSSGESQGAGFVLAQPEGNCDNFRIWANISGGWSSIDSNTAVVTGTWQHVAASYDGSTLRIYINGVLDNSGDYSGTLGGTSNSTVVGARNTADQHWYVGTADDVRIYSTARTDAQIAADYANTSCGGQTCNIATNAPATIVPSTSFATEEQGPGPVAYWKFDDGQGSTTQDSSQNNLDGTLNNTPTWQTEDFCISGKCLYFDGTNNENVSKSDDSKLDFAAADNFTVSAWAKRNGASSANNFIITKAQAGYTGYKLYQDASGDYCFDVSDGTNTDTACTSAVEFDDDKWHLVQGVKSGTTSITLYVDGNQRAQDASIAATGTLANTGTFYVGVDLDGTSNEWLGFMDDAKVYPFARTAAQILQDYNSGLANAGTKQGTSAVLGASPEKWLSDGLVGYWRMNDAGVDAEGETITDSSGNGNTGTLYGDNSIGDNGTGLDCTAAGKYGSGCSLDGTDDYASFVNSSSITSISSKGTISLWVKLNAVPSGENIAALIDVDGTGCVGRGLYFHLTSTSFKLQYGTGSCTNVISTTTPATGTWYHLVATWDSASGAKMYVNGILEDTDTSLPTFSIAQASAYIGTQAGTLRFLNGVVDETRIYNRALSPKEVSDLYNWAPGPVGYWNFDEKTGTTTYDTSGNGLSGSFGNGSIPSYPTWANGKVGGALSFDGTNDYVYVADNATLDPSVGMSLSTWIKLNALPSSGSKDYIIIDKWSGTGDQRSYEWDVLKADNKVYFYSTPDGTTTKTVTSDSALVTNTWYHLEVTYDGTTIKMYVNGVQQSSTTTTTSIYPSTTNFVIGGNDGGATANPFNGIIDDVRIYNYARTQKQVVSDMNAGHPAVGSPVGSAIGYWKFDEGADNTCSGGTNDTCNSGSQGSTLDGAGSGFSSPATASSGWTQAGKFGRALIFDGDARISITDNAAISPTTAITLSAWINPSTISGAQGVFGKYVSESNRRSYLLGLSGNKPYFILTSDGTNGANITGNTAITAGSWYHVIATYDGSNIALYVNGVFDKSTPYSNGIYDSTDPLLIGDGDANWWYFHGSIDEAKLYNYALTSNEIKTEYNKGSSMVLGTLSDNSSYQTNAANQEYCIPGDSTSCTAPVGRWDFEEGTGANAYDKSGNGYAGTVTVGASGTQTAVSQAWKTGKVGAAVNLDGTDDYIDPTAINGFGTLAGGSFTVSLWFNTGNTNTRQSIIGDWDAAGANDSFSIETGGFLQDSTHITTHNKTGGSINYLDSNVVYSTNTWYHVEVTNDASSTTRRIYVNGVLKNSDANTGINAGSKLTIGRAGAYSGLYLKGIVDQIRIYNYARTPAQVAWDFNRGSPVGWWKFDECQGTTANDSSGNGNSGTLTIGATGDEDTVGTCTTSSTAWGSGATGKRNYSLSLDGTDDYITRADDADFDFAAADNFTVSAWAKHDGVIFANPDYILTKADTTTGGYKLWMDGNGNLCFGVDDDSNWGTIDDYICTSGVDFDDSAWHLVTGVKTGTTKIELFVDGISRASDSTISATNTLANSNALYIGMDRDGTSAGWDGQIDDVRIYNYALTPVQVKDVYNNGAVNFAPSSGAP